MPPVPAFSPKVVICTLTQVSLVRNSFIRLENILKYRRKNK